MYCHWTYNVGFFIHLLSAEVLSTQQTSNYYYSKILDDDVASSRSALRQRRQIDNYDDTASSSMQVAIASSCSFDREEQNDRCSINIKSLGYDHALILNSSDQSQLLYPDNEANVKLDQNDTLLLSCPGVNNSFKRLPGSRSSGIFRCLCGSSFSGDDDDDDDDAALYDFQELTCKLRPKYEIVDKGFYGRESEYRKFEIGFRSQQQQQQQRGRQFLTLVEVHYDRSSMSTMYVKSRISRHIAGRQRPAKPLGLDQTHCCERQRNRLDMDVIYEARSQDRSFAAQLYCHDSEFRTRCSYLNVSSAIMFVAAQLAPRNSFVYDASGSASFVYLNTAPQWRPISEGNWARIEAHVVAMAEQLGRDLLVYTGVHERLSLRDRGDDDKAKAMFLHADAISGERALPVPLYFWKIVYEPASRRGVVYVTVNDIYIDRPEDYHLCEKPMFARDGARMPKQWKPRNVAKGYSYMCEVPDFMRNTAAIAFHGFSPALVTDLLYLAKK